MNIASLSEMSYNGYEDKSGDKGATQNIINLNPLFKSPTLRNVELTAPYMHDGGIPDLDSLINFYSSGIADEHSPVIPRGGFDYTEEEKSNLKAFMQTLTDITLASEEKWSNPFRKTSSTRDLQAEVSIRPNPANELAEIRIDQYENQRKDIRISDQSGRMIKQDYFFSSYFTLERGDLPTGLYFITISVGDAQGTYKLLLQ